VRCAADVRKALEQLRLCINRLALADERVQRNVAGQDARAEDARARPAPLAALTKRVTIYRED